MLWVPGGWQNQLPRHLSTANGPAFHLRNTLLSSRSASADAGIGARVRSGHDARKGTGLPRVPPMKAWRAPRRSRHDDVRIPAVWLAIILSLLIHSVALFVLLPHMRLLSPENADNSSPSSPLVAQLSPRSEPLASAPAAAPPPPAPSAVPAPARKPPSPRVPTRPQVTPPVITQPQKSPIATAPPPPPPASPPTPAPSAPTDLSSYIESQRRAKGEADPNASAGRVPNMPPTEDENERKNRIVAANLGNNTAPTFGNDPRNSGGIFHIERMDYSDAEFDFYGWNKDIKRKSKQRIEVRKGENGDIRIAIIRRMIVIIRENESGDFSWQSYRLGRDVILSARPADTAGLEDFMMQEFFGDERRAR
jgi:hypothetical protein